MKSLQFKDSLNIISLECTCLIFTILLHPSIWAKRTATNDLRRAHDEDAAIRLNPRTPPHVSRGKKKIALVILRNMQLNFITFDKECEKFMETDVWSYIFARVRGERNNSLEYRGFVWNFSSLRMLTRCIRMGCLTTSVNVVIARKHGNIYCIPIKHNNIRS